MLIPSGEGDCGSFARVADDLARDFSVLTFDMPGFSRSSPPPDWRDVGANAVAGQIAALTASVGIERATFYGCSSGGLFALALAAEHPDVVESVFVHEVAVPLKDAPTGGGPFAQLFSPDDSTVVETCKLLFRNVMNEDQQAWDDLGPDYHRRLEKNYLTWARRYVGAALTSGVFRELTAQDLARRPITWTVGGLSGSTPLVEGNRRLADVGGIEIGLLPCRHFPQVSIPDRLAQHIRAGVPRH
ncbi:MAG TPA: alpha/beta hydrolase [Gammaproteobacteria bacterium]|nr:alpha/beta hydrolase [Gammaproteobacteria bacterium]